MAVEGPALVLFCGGVGGSDIEEAFSEALRACALDTLTEALGMGAFEVIVLVVDEASAAYFAANGQSSDKLRTGSGKRAKTIVDVDAPEEAFHFGRRLSDAVRRYGLNRPVYVGSGLPLIKGDELAAVASTLKGATRAVVSNNFFSADMVGFVPGAVVDEVELPDNDRILSRLLFEKAGLENRALPRTFANQFDIDTPGDLAVLAYAGGAGPNLQRYIDEAGIDVERLRRAASLFTDRDAEVLVAGRVGSQTWQYLEAETACRIRMFSEERGMQAAGREKGAARSLLAYHLQQVGFARFFEELESMCQAAFVDTRSIFAHMGLEPSRPDRFRSDAMTPKGIDDAWVRDFTAAACEAPVPVILGGASLVAAGVQLLSEAAWREQDRLAPGHPTRRSSSN